MKPLPIVVGVGVAVLVSGGFGLFGAANGADLGLLPILLGALLGGFTAYIMWNLQGTRASQAADPSLRERALGFAPLADRAAIYFVRTGFVGRAAGMNMAIDGKPVAQLKSPRFTYVEVLPGEHHVEAGFVGGAGAQNTAATLNLRCAAGEIVVLHISPKMGTTKNQIIIERWTMEAAREKLPNVAMVAPEPAWAFAG